MSCQNQLIISVSWWCDIWYFVCLFIYTVFSSPCVVPTVTCTTNKCIIVIPWAVKAVTIGMAPPFLTAHYTGVGWMFTMSLCRKRNLGSLCFDWMNWVVLLFNASLKYRGSIIKLKERKMDSSPFFFFSIAALRETSS